MIVLIIRKVLPGIMRNTLVLESNYIIIGKELHFLEIFQKSTAFEKSLIKILIMEDETFSSDYSDSLNDDQSVRQEMMTTDSDCSTESSFLEIDMENEEESDSEKEAQVAFLTRVKIFS